MSKFLNLMRFIGPLFGIADILYGVHLLQSRPTHIDYARHLVHPFNDKGTIVYFSTLDFAILYLLAGLAFIGIVAANLAQSKTPRP